MVTYYNLAKINKDDQFREKLPEKSQRLIQSAERWLDADLAILPILFLGKDPVTELLPNHSTNELRKKTADLASVFGWFQRFPHLNLGIFTGEVSGPEGQSLVVLDWDTLDIEPEFSLPDTATVHTSRGRHEYYYADGVIDGKKSVPLDFQAEGNYVIAPGSTHESQEMYRLQGDSLTDNIAHLPAEKVEAVQSFIRSQKADFPTITGGISSSKDWIEKAGDEAVVSEVIEHAGIEWPGLKTNFDCPIHGDNKTKSGAFDLQPDADASFICFHDFHQPSSPDWWPIPDLYASIKNQKPIHFGAVGQNGRRQTGKRRVWWLRALDEAGVINRPDRIGPMLPDDYPDKAKELFNGFRYLLELRAIHDSDQTATPFSYEFALEWTSIGSKQTVQKYMKQLFEDGFLTVVEKRDHPKANLITFNSDKY